MNFLEKTAEDNQRGSPLYFFLDKILTKCEEGTSNDNPRGKPLDFFRDQFEMKYYED
jgi:hypothetical protein